jgi:starch synthase
MRVWLPYVHAGSGTDVYTHRLARGLREAGVDVVVTRLARRWQYVPWMLRAVRAPVAVDLIVTNTWNGFAFERSASKLVVIEHLFVLDPVLEPYKNTLQKVFHNTLVRQFVHASARVADAVVAVSEYTASALSRGLGCDRPRVIKNGIDTNFFCPGLQGKEPLAGRTFRLLFIGNLSRRKGADLLPAIMDQLGPGFELAYTSGLRDARSRMRHARLKPLGQLGPEGIKAACRQADALVFPSRLEGFGYAAAEAMACGTPVVAADTSSLPELIDHGRTGFLCKVDDVADFARAIRKLAASDELRRCMSVAARQRAVKLFRLETMVRQYCALFARLVNGRQRKS